MSSISERLQEIQHRIEQSAVQANRNPNEIRLISVSKTYGPEIIAQGYEAGIRAFGENKVQEIQQKFDPKPERDIELHMIGHLQSNKARVAVQLSDWIQSIDRPKILQAVSRYAQQYDKTVQICLEVNSSGEQQKHGATSDTEVFTLVDQALNLPNIALRGLMTVGPLRSQGEADLVRAFERVRQLHLHIGEQYQLPHWDTLSMGMSGDFDLAIAHGANMLRIGSAIFGARSYGSKELP